MRHFATESGKSKGQFYTPAEVSRVIARVIGISPENTKASTTAYDPTCGSGSLLLKVAAEAGKHITLEGQERDVTTAGLAHMNIILHDSPPRTSCRATRWRRPSSRTASSSAPTTTSSPIRRFPTRPGRPDSRRRRVAVGTPVARRPPRRSQRALLTHWAPASGANVEAHSRPGMLNLGFG
jgi:hypothetical protein